jgi:hypothetical protein
MEGGLREGGWIGIEGIEDMEPVDRVALLAACKVVAVMLTDYTCSCLPFRTPSPPPRLLRLLLTQHTVHSSHCSSEY